MNSSSEFNKNSNDMQEEDNDYVKKGIDTLEAMYPQL